MSSPVSRQFWSMVADRIERDPAALDRGRAQLLHWRRQRGATASDRYWTIWDRLIDAGTGAVAATLREPTEHGDTLRSCAPFFGLVGRRERWALYRQDPLPPRTRVPGTAPDAPR